jgi:predicted DNA-binding transcriptional regulator YafY
MAETTFRILALLNLLQAHRQWSGPDLAARLGVTDRTLRRDVVRLRELGYGVEAARGAAGGYRLEGGAALPPLLLTDDEAVAMAVGLRVAASEELVDGEQTTLGALAKLEQVLPPALRGRVNALARVVRPRNPRAAAVSPASLGQLALACRDRERIRFHYRAPSGAESDRVVEPHSLVSSGGRWFLVGWDIVRADWRIFRVDRMSRFFGTRLHVGPRDLPIADAAEFVAQSIAAWGRTAGAEVVMRMPLEAMQAQFGRWAVGAVAVDDESTAWPIPADSPEGVFAAIAWVPPGVEYELRGPAELLDPVREALARLGRALA